MSEPFEVKMTKRLGKGSYGLVFLVKGDPKHVYKIFIDDTSSYDLIELDIMFRVHHSNLMRGSRMLTANKIPSVGSTITLYPDSRGDYLVIEMERAKGDLFDWKEQPHSMEEKLYVYWQILQGLKCLHNARILHLDIKPENVMVYNNNHVKLGDFGLCIPMASHERIRTYDAKRITPTYRPPEGFDRDVVLQYSESSDVWSLGILLAELFLPPTRTFFIDNEKRIKKIFSTEEEIEKYFRSRFGKSYKNPVFAQVFDLIRKILKNDPVERLTVKEIMQHPVFEPYNFSMETGYLTQPRFKFPYRDDSIAQLKIFLNESVKFLKIYYDSNNPVLHSEAILTNYPVEMFFTITDLFLRYRPYYNSNVFVTMASWWIGSIIYGPYSFDTELIERFVKKKITNKTMHEWIFMRGEGKHNFLHNTPFDEAHCTCKIKFHLQMLFLETDKYIDQIAGNHAFDGYHIRECDCGEKPSWDLIDWIDYLSELHDTMNKTLYSS